jgi:hypothetical protein
MRATLADESSLAKLKMASSFLELFFLSARLHQRNVLGHVERYVSHPRHED